MTFVYSGVDLELFCRLVVILLRRRDCSICIGV